MNLAILCVALVALVLSFAAFWRSRSPRSEPAVGELVGLLREGRDRAAEDAAALGEALAGFQGVGREQVESLAALGSRLEDLERARAASAAAADEGVRAGFEALRAELVRSRELSEAQASRRDEVFERTLATLPATLSGALGEALGRQQAPPDATPAVARLGQDLERAFASLQGAFEAIGPELREGVAPLGQGIARGFEGLSELLRGELEGRMERDASREVARKEEMAAIEAGLAASREIARSATEGLSAVGDALASGLEELKADLAAGSPIPVLEAGFSRLEATMAGANSSFDPELALESVVTRLEQGVANLPRAIAEELAARPAPHPELEELAVAVREAGALRGDAARGLSDAVARVGAELQEQARAGLEAREQSAQALSLSLEELSRVANVVDGALAPLAEALRRQAEATGPVAEGLEATRDRLEEIASSLRSNQVEFSSSVELFTTSAQELSRGLSAFARDGEEREALDPHAAQQALLAALETLLGGFAESLRGALAESDLRLRETLAELAARLPEASA